MEQWAREWLEGERANGAKRLEIKNRGSKHYVYESTTHWDSVLKKRVKTSKYKGKLDPEQGFIESKGMNGFDMGPVRNVTEYGNAMLLRVAMEDLKPLLVDAFPDSWEAIYALSVNGNPKIPNYGNEISSGVLKTFAFCGSGLITHLGST